MHAAIILARSGHALITTNPAAMLTHALSPIDPIVYLRPPRLGVDSGLSLAKMLLAEVPEEPNPGVLAAAKALAVTVTTLETSRRVQSKPSVASILRPADLRLDRAWAAVEGRLTPWSIFDANDPDRLRSVELHARLFFTGLDFLKLPFIEEHAQSELRVQIIATEGLRADLDRLVGEDFVKELLAAHKAYGEVLGITKAGAKKVGAKKAGAKKAGKRTAPPTTLLDHLRVLHRAIASYALQVVAFAELRPDNVEPARLALEPIDAFRRAVARRTASGSSEETVDEIELPEGAPAPDAPIPELPQG
jgi:hypothetical protein